MARFAGLGLEPILADSDDDEGDLAFRRGGFGMRGGDNRNGKGGGNDAVRERQRTERHSSRAAVQYLCVHNTYTAVYVSFAWGFGLVSGRVRRSLAHGGIAGRASAAVPTAGVGWRAFCCCKNTSQQTNFNLGLACFLFCVFAVATKTKQNIGLQPQGQPANSQLVKKTRPTALTYPTTTTHARYMHAERAAIISPPRTYSYTRRLCVCVLIKYLLRV